MGIEISSGFSIAKNSNNGTPPPTETLQFYLQAAPSSGTTWTDASGNGYHATIHGTTSYVSNNGGGIKLQNSANSSGNAYISVPYNASSNTLTVEIVGQFNPNSFWASIWGNESYTNSGGYFAYMGSSTNINFGAPYGTTTKTITASNAIRHWTFVIDGTSASLYLNGSQVGTTGTITNQTNFTTNNFYFGARHSNGGGGYTDVMNNSLPPAQPVFYQMKVYDKALSSSEVTTNFDAIKSIYGL
jgi:hypothetical protein